MKMEQAEKRAKRKGNLERAVYRFRKNFLSLAGLSIILMVILIAIFAPLIAPYPEDARGALNFKNTFQPPTFEHPFGTDEAGRDMLSRVIFGARLSLLLGVIVLSVATSIGVPLGLFAGYLGGVTEMIIMRTTDVFLALPPIVLPIVISAILTPSLQTSMFAISFSWWPWFTRLVYGETLSIKQEDFVEVARSLGASSRYIMFQEILPNLTSPLVVKVSLDMGYAILTGAALAFLGLGAQPPTPEWGTMATVGRNYIPEAWWLTFFPGLAIFVTVLGFNLLGDGLRDFFDVTVE